MTFIDELTAIAAERYQDKHPFNRAMHEGRLTRAQLGGWVANRFYYQTRIPIKDALIVSKSNDPAFRRAWTRRIHDHDGVEEGEGGLAQWLRLADALGLETKVVASCDRVLPAVRQACDRYVELVRAAPLVVAVATSLTQLFAPDLMVARLVAWERHYPWVDPDALACFRSRVTRARRDGDESLAFVREHAGGNELQAWCLSAFRTKCEIVWTLLDSVAAVYGIGGSP